MHGLVFLLLCQPLLPDRLLAWESRSLVRRSINSYHTSFAGRKSSAIRHLLSAGRWAVVCRWSAFFGKSFGYLHIMSVVAGGKALPSDSYSLVSVVALWRVALIPYHASCFLVGRLLSSESYSLVGGSVLSHRASWGLVGRLRW